MKKYLNLYLVPALVAALFLTSCGSSSSSTSSTPSRSMHHYHHGHPHMGYPYYYNRDIIIIDDVDPDYGVGIPDISPETMLPILDDE